MNYEQVKFIHEYLVRFFENSDDPISPSGIKNEETLKSAVARPFMSVGGQDAYKGIFPKAAALFHSIINNHSFHNGNKRAALLTTIVFLSENGWWISRPNDDELFEFTRQAAAHELCNNRVDELDYITKWFRSNCRRRVIYNHGLKLHQLRQILSEFEFTMIENNKNRFEIYNSNGDYITDVIKKGKHGKEDYDVAYISKLRKKLKLTEEYGIDSQCFYGGFSEISMNKFMHSRHEVMRKLAKI
ncbi:death-on-curing family protein [Acinetobacter baumannii OIFC0162]|uniref:type II toxin-antitoxin system death-on-curing family toxin n=1 Tax=Acinetobacter TaxID=469 RepID=UPI00028CC285|nr:MULTISPECIES: type II toxin-antitoxin system death-on-curing family toxin [Acinetobacter]EHU1601900.1 type II toxin-antitoxin system death-on-curing family toxin [Acinetobacter baumannii]EHU2431838.1 type II toxin-antitoxin system death-on-curing family toxin [Acinetobacter baumannii]EHU2606255.1 type II toxin-antitoxin system death-on-curing family toxin [Acinetobacter baumannii]EHU2649577.1 type II toxin-antitoxin system death-on-curing family toxin [Acinetobacter baumannii]EIB6857548.1 t